jgi:hypothetical protein
LPAKEPKKLADFYKAASGWQEVSRLDILRCRGIVLSDGAINISVLQFSGTRSAAAWYSPAITMGIYVDDMAEAEEKCLALGAIPYDGLPEDRNEVNYGPQVQGPGRQSVRHQRRAVAPVKATAE